MGSKFFEELSRCLGKEQIESLSKEDRRLEIFLHGQPVLSVSPGNEVFMLPSGSKNPEANELYHRVAIAADRVFEYVEAMENTPLLRARGLDNKFHLLADFGGAVLAGRERGTGRGYEFVTWIWDYERVGVSHGHYYEDDFAGAKRDFAVRSGLIPKASLSMIESWTRRCWFVVSVSAQIVYFMKKKYPSRTRWSSWISSLTMRQRKSKRQKTQLNTLGRERFRKPYWGSKRSLVRTLSSKV